MNIKQTLSWKFLIPFGIVWVLIFNNSVLALIGTISFLLGLVDLGRQIFKKKDKQEPPPNFL